MIKLSYEMSEEGMKKAEKTKVSISAGRMYVQYNVPGKAEQVVNQMRKDGKRGVLFSRGAMIQNFPGKTEDEILVIVKKDIKAGVYAAKEKTGKIMNVKNLTIEKK